MGLFVEIILQSSLKMSVTALVTLAITIIFKTSFTTNFSQGVISAFGAFVASYAISTMNVPLFLAIPIGMLVSMLIALFVDVVIFRNGRYVNALGKQIITMGLISLITGAIPLIFGLSDYTISPMTGTGEIWTIDFGADQQASVSVDYLIGLGIAAVVIAAIFILLRFSKWGLSVRATASNEYVAGMMGINTHLVTAISWGLAGALGALAACINASCGGNVVTSFFMTETQVIAFIAGILGGFSTFHGPVIAAFMIPLANNLVVYFLSIANLNEYTEWSMAIVYAIALVIIFFKPQGIFGKKIARKV